MGRVGWFDDVFFFADMFDDFCIDVSEYQDLL